MSQIVDAYVRTVTTFIDAHRSKLVVGVLVVVSVGIVLKVLHRVLSDRGSDRS
jgi:hypothetical protein